MAVVVVVVVLVDVVVVVVVVVFIATSKDIVIRPQAIREPLFLF